MTRTVLYVHSSAGRYGADRQLLAIVGGLDPARYSPLVVLPETGPLADDLEAAGAEVILRPSLAVMRRGLFSPTGLAGVARRYAGDRSALRALARERDAALIHANTSVCMGAFAPGLPLVASVREIYADVGRLWPLYRRFLLRADALACVSEAVRVQFGGSPKARVVHDGVTSVARRAPRAEARAALGLPESAFVCAVLGRLSAWKGQEVLVRALTEPAAPAETVVLVAGDALEERHEHALHELVRSLGVGDRVRFLGFREDVEVVHGAADVVVVPSTRPDPLPNSALEAAAAGCCVVAAAHGGLPEIVRDGETGRLVAPNDPAALATVLAALHADPAERDRLGRAAAADVADRFSVARLLAQTQALYDQSLGVSAR